MYLPRGEHTTQAVCIVIHRRHGMHTVQMTLLFDTTVLFLRTAIRGTPILLGSVHFPSGEDLETERADLALADRLQGAMRERRHEEDVCVGMDAIVEVASSHSVAGRAGVIGGQTNRSTLRAGTMKKVEALEKAMAANVASPMFFAITQVSGGCTRQPLGEQQGRGTQRDNMAVKALWKVKTLQVRCLTSRISDHAAIMVHYVVRAGRTAVFKEPGEPRQRAGWSTRKPMEYRKDVADELLEHSDLLEASYAIARLAEEQGTTADSSAKERCKADRGELHKKMIGYARAVLGNKQEAVGLCRQAHAERYRLMQDRWKYKARHLL